MVLFLVYVFLTVVSFCFCLNCCKNWVACVSMSWIPVFSSFLISFFLISFFMWVKFGLLLSVVGVFFLLPYLVSEVSSLRDRRCFSFILFMASEAIIFMTLFFVVLWYEDENVSPISSWSNLPLEGCYLLIVSSLAVTVFHNRYDPSGRSRTWGFLLIAIFLGLGFVFLQWWEMLECRCDISFCAYYSSSFCTVGLHFVHVVLGLVVLFYVYANFVGPRGLSVYYVTMSIWYWHFVDYIWLAVFAVVYLI